MQQVSLQTCANSLDFTLERFLTFPTLTFCLIPLPIDMWAAGVCLYIFVAGKLPFFSYAPLDLMEAIAEGGVPFDELNVSDDCLSLLQKARDQRIAQLDDQLMMSRREIIVGDEDLRAVSVFYSRRYYFSFIVFCTFGFER